MPRRGQAAVRCRQGQPWRGSTKNGARCFESKSGGRVKEPQAHLGELEHEVERLVDAIIKVGASDNSSAPLAARTGEGCWRRGGTHDAKLPVGIDRMVRDTRKSTTKSSRRSIGTSSPRDQPSPRSRVASPRLDLDESGSIGADPENKTAQTPVGAGLLASLSVVAGAGFEPTTFGL